MSKSAVFPACGMAGRPAWESGGPLFLRGVGMADGRTGDGGARDTACIQ